MEESPQEDKGSVVSKCVVNSKSEVEIGNVEEMESAECVKIVPEELGSQKVNKWLGSTLKATDDDGNNDGGEVGEEVMERGECSKVIKREEGEVGITGVDAEVLTSMKNPSRLSPDSANMSATTDTLGLNNKYFHSEFQNDQVRVDNFTDLDIICKDGFMPVHRCLLMGASTFLRDLLIARDITDTTAISLPDISISNLKDVVALLYGGKTVIDKSNEGEILGIMKMLGFPVNDILCRIAKEDDHKRIAPLRYKCCTEWMTKKDTVEDPQEDSMAVNSSSSTIEISTPHNCAINSDDNQSGVELEEDQHQVTSQGGASVRDKEWDFETSNPECVKQATTNDPLSTNAASLAKDLSFEEACSGLEQQMAQQAVKLKKKRRRQRNLTGESDDASADSKSLSSNTSGGSSNRSTKRRKISVSSKDISAGKNESFDQFIERLGHPSNTYTNVDINALRTEFQITNQMDIHNLSLEDRRLLFQRCPLCKFKHDKMKSASRCLRNHGYRICWVCLQLLPISDNEFEEHTKAQHLRGPDGGRVTCPFCLKEFEGSIGLPTHMGNFHYPRIAESIEEMLEVSPPNSTSSESSVEPMSLDTELTAEDTQFVIGTYSDVEEAEAELADKIHTVSVYDSAAVDQPETDLNNISKLTDSTDDSKQAPSGPVYCATSVPAEIAQSMDELSEMIKSCQICNKIYHVSESATKCLKQHGYRRCWGCIKVFPIADIPDHVKEVHSIPGKPRMVACFLCSNPYAYDKSLNLHIGKHMAIYERQMGIKTSSRKRYGNRAGRKMRQSKSVSEEPTEGTNDKPQDLKKVVVTQIRKRAKLQKKKKKVSPSKKKKTTRSLRMKVKNGKGKVEKPEANVANTGGDCGENDLSTDVPGMSENGLQKPPAVEPDPDSKPVNPEKMLKLEHDNKQGVSATPMSRVFLENKEIHGIKYNIYGLMDPVKGIQSGKTIAIMVSCDQNAVNVNGSSQI